MEGFLTIFIIFIIFIALVREAAEPVVIFFLSVVTFLTLGIIDMDEALSGFSNPGILTIASLFIIAGSVQRSHYIFSISNNIFEGRYRGRRSIIKAFSPVLVSSAFLNNTPVVALFIPMVRDWGRRVGIDHSKLLIPLSYVSIFGGTLTLVGTSTNLVVNGLMIDAGVGSLGIFTLTRVTGILVILGSFYLLFIGRSLLPEISDTISETMSSSKEYLVRFSVEKECRIIGSSVDRAGLRNLEGLYLIEIKRSNSKVIAPVERDEIIREGDTLIFTGRVNSLGKLQAIRGLKLRSGGGYTLEDLSNGRADIVETVVSESFSGFGRTVKEMNFRGRYNAAVIAVIRNGRRMEGKIGDLRLKMGDTLLLIAGKEFQRSWESSEDFYLITRHQTEGYIESRKGMIPIGVFLMVLLLSLSGILSILHASFLGLAVIFMSKVIHPRECVKMMDWNTLVVIALSFSMGKAIINSGAAEIVAGELIKLSSIWGYYGALVLIYLLANIFTEMITNNAAAVLSFPIALEVSKGLGSSPMPFIAAVAIGASASFASPYGYQTNLMVYGAGGYRFKDFLRVGIPLNLLFMVGSVVLIPVFFPF